MAHGEPVGRRMAPEEGAKLLGLYREQEALLEDLYKDFAERFPHFREFWSDLAAQEREHTSWLDAFQAGAAGGTIRVHGASLRLPAIEAQVERLREGVKGGFKRIDSMDRALDTAMAFERTLIEKQLFGAFESDDPSLKKVLSRLSEQTGDHYKRIREVTLRRNKYSGLLETGSVSLRNLQAAIDEAQDQGTSVSGILMSRFKVPKAVILKHLSEFFRVPAFDLGVDPAPPPELTDSLWERHDEFVEAGFVPVGLEDEALVIVTDDPKDVVKRDAIGRAFENRRIVFRVATQDDIRTAADLYYGKPEPEATESMRDVVEELGAQVPLLEDEAAGVPEISEEHNVIVRLVNRIVEDAHRSGASDIHLEPGDGGTSRVRYRIDGVLWDAVQYPGRFHHAVISRIKIMAGLDIAEKRKPQSGKIAFRRWGRLDVELRLETYPTVPSREDAVLRILTSAEPKPLDGLALSAENLSRFKALIERPYGLILCVGPTGSGKTTTLHAALGHVNSPGVKILTVEDPVEITQGGLRQVQVNPRAGVTFASAMRSFLRADPDIIMVGEMRDEETAVTAVEASLTGHLVLSTLHTNSAPETITRLLDLGIDPFSFADSLLGVLAQRLVRKLCPECRRKETLGADLHARIREEYGAGAGFDALGFLPDSAVFKADAKGCDACRESGFRGRIALHELMVVDDAIRGLVHGRSRSEEIRDAAARAGMKTLKQDGLEKVLAGLTTLEEILAAANR